MKFHVIIICVCMLIVVMIGSVQLHRGLRDQVMRVHTHDTPPTPQKAKLSPLSNNGTLQSSNSKTPLSSDISRVLPNTIPQRCTVVVVIPKCTVVVQGGLSDKSPLSKCVDKNIKRDVILERGGRTNTFDLEVFE